MTKLLALDIGGTFVKYGVWSEGKLGVIQKIVTPDNYEALVFEIEKTIAKFNLPFEGVAISSPGVIDQETGMVKGISALMYLHHFEIVKDLEARLGLPVYMENDANCAGYCEMAYGSGRDSQNTVFVIIGTGVGGSIFLNRESFKGSHNFAGEFGLSHTRDGKVSYAVSIVKQAVKYSQQTGEMVDGEELFKRKKAGDLLATELIEQFYDNLAQFLYNLLVILDPDLISIGGGVSAQLEISSVIEEKLLKMLAEDHLEEYLPTIKVNQFGNNANLIGAALFFEKYKKGA